MVEQFLFLGWNYRPSHPSGISEVISHRYGERKDELTAAKQIEVQRHHDEDMARVQRDAAQANERAAQLEKEAEIARKATADANARALEAQLALEKFKQPRKLSDAQISSLREKLNEFAGKHTSMQQPYLGIPRQLFFFLLSPRLWKVRGGCGSDWNTSHRTFCDGVFDTWEAQHRAVRLLRRRASTTPQPRRRTFEAPRETFWEQRLSLEGFEV